MDKEVEKHKTRNDQEPESQKDFVRSYERIMGFDRYESLFWLLVKVIIGGLFLLALNDMLPRWLAATVFLLLIVVYTWNQFVKQSEALTRPQYWIGLTFALVVFVLVGFHILTYQDQGDLNLDFAIKNDEVVYNIKNVEDVVADLSRVEFVMYAIGSHQAEKYALEIPPRELSYVGKKSSVGYYRVSDYFPGIHRDDLTLAWEAFGYASVSCKNCMHEKRYWIYVHGDSSFVSEFHSDDSLNVDSLYANRRQYVEKIVPAGRQHRLKRIQ